MKADPEALRTELIHYRQTGDFSRRLFKELERLAQLVLRSRGISQPDVRENIFSAFLQKLLRYKGDFYLKLESYHIKQIRSFLIMTLKCCIADYFRAQKFKEESFDALLESEASPAELKEIFVGLHPYYEQEAQAVYLLIWQKLSQDLRRLFCLVYDAGAKTQQLADALGVSLGKIDKDKKRIAQCVASESSVTEVGLLVYNLISRRLCVLGEPVSHPE